MLVHDLFKTCFFPVSNSGAPHAENLSSFCLLDERIPCSVDPIQNLLHSRHVSCIRLIPSSVPLAPGDDALKNF